MQTNAKLALDALKQQLAACTQRVQSDSGALPQAHAPPIRTGLAMFDVFASACSQPASGMRLAENVSAGLLPGMLHELLGVKPLASSLAKARPWLPPLAIVMHIACCALEQTTQAASSLASAAPRVLWIGKDCWPSPLALDAHPRTRALLHASVFIDASSVDERAWALDVALRSRVPRVVVADVSGLSFAHSRRLQLAIEGSACLCLIARPAWEEHEPSAAGTRWLVSNAMGERPAWDVRMLRCKGQAQALGEAQRNVEARHGTVELDAQTAAIIPLARAGDGDCAATARDSRDGSCIEAGRAQSKAG
jgi:hypothetical protein